MSTPQKWIEKSVCNCVEEGVFIITFNEDTLFLLYVVVYQVSCLWHQALSCITHSVTLGNL